MSETRIFINADQKFLSLTWAEKNILKALKIVFVEKEFPPRCEAEKITFESEKPYIAPPPLS